MTNVQEIEKSILSLSRKDYEELRRWFLERDWDEWDMEIEQDASSGKRDFLLQEAAEAKRRGKLQVLSIAYPSLTTERKKPGLLMSLLCFKNNFREMQMRTEQIKIEIEGLELSEKLLLVEDLWDSIAASNSELPMPEWQREELNRRYKEYQQGNLVLHDWQNVHEELREKYKSN